MHPVLVAYAGDVSLTKDVSVDAAKLLLDRGCAQTADHSRRVAAEAKRLAQHWGEDEARAEVAGWLHDISAIVPADHRLQVTDMLGLEVLAEERAAPVLVHQRLSAAIAQEVFGIIDRSVLSAIGCHTTLKANSSGLDKIVFVADKMEWDQSGDPPYLTAMASAAEQSLELAACFYLAYLWQRRETLPAMHPWAAQAYRELLASVPWYHGSPFELKTIREGSTITLKCELARIFSKKPAIVSVSDDGQIKHNGTMPDYLYTVADEIQPEDVVPHPRATMALGDEWLTARERRLRLLHCTEPAPEEQLTDEECAVLQGRLVEQGKK